MTNKRRLLQAALLGTAVLFGTGVARGETNAPAMPPAGAKEVAAPTAPKAEAVVHATNAPAPSLVGISAAAMLRILKAEYVDHARLDDAAVQSATINGLLAALGPGAVVLPRATAASNQAARAVAGVSSQALAHAEIIKPDIGYLRLAEVTPAAVTALDDELKNFAAAKVTGFILDLRFADGTNYEAAAAVAGRFHADGGPLFVLKTAGAADQQFAAPRRADVPAAAAGPLGDSPLILLVNHETRGSAEALAGALRAQDRGILVGNPSAGNAAAWKDVPLTDDQVLRVATAKIVLVGSNPEHPLAGDLFPKGLTPDIAVPLDLAVERDVVLHPATNVTLTASLQPRLDKKRMSEADLVKAFRGEAVDEGKPNGDPDTAGEIQEVKDKVLQRAVDVLKGIRMLVSWR